MAALQKFNVFGTDCLRGKHKFDAADQFKVALTNIAPDATDTTFATLGTPISSTGNGYPVGGGTLIVALSTAGAVAKVTIQDFTFTAAGGSPIGPFRYGAIYNNTESTKPLVGWFDHGASITLATGETFKVDFDQTNGAFTLA
jgi:hypothetical protein